MSSRASIRLSRPWTALWVGWVLTLSSDLIASVSFRDHIYSNSWIHDQLHVAGAAAAAFLYTAFLGTLGAPVWRSLERAWRWWFVGLAIASSLAALWAVLVWEHVG